MPEASEKVEVEKLADSQSAILQLQYPYAIPPDSSKTMGHHEDPAKGNGITEHKGTLEDHNLNTSRVVLTAITATASVLLLVSIILESIAHNHDMQWQRRLEGKDVFPFGHYIEGKKLRLGSDGSLSSPKAKKEAEVYEALSREGSFQEPGYIIGLVICLIGTGALAVPIWSKWMKERVSFFIVAALFFLLGAIALVSCAGVILSAKSIQSGYQTCYDKLHEVATYHSNHDVFEEGNARALSASEDDPKSVDELTDMLLDLTHDIDDPYVLEHLMDPGHDHIKIKAIGGIKQGRTFEETKKELKSHRSQHVHARFHTSIVDMDGVATFVKEVDKNFKEAEMMSFICYICGQDPHFGESVKKLEDEDDVQKIVIVRNDLNPSVEDSYEFDSLKSLTFCQEESIKLSSLIITIISAFVCFCGCISSAIFPCWVLHPSLRPGEASPSVAGGDGPADSFNHTGDDASIMGPSQAPSITDNY